MVLFAVPEVSMVGASRAAGAQKGRHIATRPSRHPPLRNGREGARGWPPTCCPVAPTFRLDSHRLNFVGLPCRCNAANV